jgi:hypothetical protein
LILALELLVQSFCFFLQNIDCILVFYQLCLLKSHLLSQLVYFHLQEVYLGGIASPLLVTVSGGHPLPVVLFQTAVLVELQVLSRLRVFEGGFVDLGEYACESLFVIAFGEDRQVEIPAPDVI